MTMLPRAGSLGVAAGAAYVDAAGNPATPSAPSAIPPCRTRRRLRCDASTMVQILPYSDADFSCRRLFNTHGEIESHGLHRTVAACGCGKLPNRRGRGAHIGLARGMHRPTQCPRPIGAK